MNQGGDQIQIGTGTKEIMGIDRFHTNMSTTISFSGMCESLTTNIDSDTIEARNILFLVLTWYVHISYVDFQYVHGFIHRFSVLVH